MAILVDALIVRMLLVPAIMHLLGDRAWYIPRWLDKVLPRLTIEPEEHDEETSSDSASDEREEDKELVPVG